MITVAIVDDHPVVRSGMRTVLESAGDISVVAEGGSGQEALLLVEKYAPAVLVLDINLPDKSGIEVAGEMHAQAQGTAILILTMHDDPQMVFELLDHGAIGYVLKDEALETLASAVRAAARGESWLSPAVASHVVRRAVSRSSYPSLSEKEAAGTPLTAREYEILQLLAAGLDNTAIAESLTITKRTVQNHIHNIYDKLGVASRTEAVLHALRQGWARLPSDGENTNDS